MINNAGNEKKQTPTTQIVIFFGSLQIIGLLLNLKVSVF